MLAATLILVACIPLLFLPPCTGLAPASSRLAGQQQNSLCRCNGDVVEVPATPAGACPQGHRFQAAAAAAPGAPTPQLGCCIPDSCPAHPPPQSGLQSQQRQQGQRTHAAAGTTAAPAPDWMTQCCGDMLLRQMYLPGSHDSGTYLWTTPQHMPLVLDEVLTILFNIVGDLSRTQKMDVYQQLQAGARVLDIRLAVNPWLAVQGRMQQQATSAASSSATSFNAAPAPPSTQQVPAGRGLAPALIARAVTAVTAALHWPARMLFSEHAPGWRQQQRSAPVLTLDPALLEGRLDMAVLGGPLTAEERRGCITTSHSLPGAPLATVLADIRRFLAENPGELLVLLVKADTIDVNVAGSQRFTEQDWAAAAEVFERELQGVQLVDERQVQTLTVGQLAAGSRGGGSVLLYSRELQAQGMVAVNSRQAYILESWGNGTNTDDLGDLKQRLVQWLQFWRAHWRQNRKPFLLLASAQVTLGVRTILTMVKNRVWRWHSTAQQQLRQQQQGMAGGEEQRSLLRALSQWEQLQRHQTVPAGWVTSSWWPWQQQKTQQQQQQAAALGSGLTTLYQLGVETNQQMLQEVLGNSEVPKEFNVWSLDALTPDLCSYIINLNTPVKPTAQQ